MPSWPDTVAHHKRRKSGERKAERSVLACIDVSKFGVFDDPVVAIGKAEGARVSVPQQIQPVCYVESTRGIINEYWSEFQSHLRKIC
jgi:hypothetical protein